MRKFFIAAMMSAALCAGISAFAARDDSSSYSVKHTTHATVKRGTDEYDQVVEWLDHHDAPGYTSQPDQFNISLTTSSVVASGTSGYSSIPGPPVPLPSTGQTGDKLTITSCTAGGMQQSWTYQYTGNSSPGSNGCPMQ